MKEIMILSFGLIASLIFCHFSFADTQKSKGAEIISQMDFPELKFNQPKPKKTVLKNGLTVYCMESTGGSLVNLNVVVKAGSIYDSEEKTGLASFAGYMINSGGATEDASEFFGKLEQLGISFGAEINTEAGELHLSCLREDLSVALDVLRETLMNPRYNQKTLDLCRSQVLETFRKISDSPRAIIRQNLPRLIYEIFPYNNGGVMLGSGYRGGKIIYGATPESIERITLRDLREFHEKYFKPQNILLGISGGFDDGDKKRITNAFRGWENKRKSNLEVLPVKADVSANPGIYFTPKEGLTQSTLALGHISSALKNSEDYFPLQILAEIFGESFTSRLNQEVRVKRGLAYSVGGYFSWKHSYPGLFIVFTKTKSESTVDVINVVVNEIEKIIDEGVTDKELREVKESIENQFVFNFVSKSSVLEKIMYLDYFREPNNYFDTYLNNIRQVTKNDVLRVAKKYLHPDKLTTVIVGNPAILPDLEKEFGKVTVIDIK